MAEETRDRLVRAKDIDKEWQSFLLQRRGDIWPEEFNRFAAESARCKDWQDALEKSLRASEEVRVAFSGLS
jgi:hypothetical protein